jgi:hypothetical protein
LGHAAQVRWDSKVCELEAQANDETGSHEEKENGRRGLDDERVASDNHDDERDHEQDEQDAGDDSDTNGGAVVNGPGRIVSGYI